jgi:hypothetical protein
VTDAKAYIADDPDQLYKAVSVGDTAGGTGLVPVALTQSTLGNNVALVLNTGLTTTGNSRIGIYANGVTTSLPMRVVDMVPDTANSSGNFFEVIVKFNFGYHSYNNATGI